MNKVYIMEYSESKWGDLGPPLPIVDIVDKEKKIKT